MIAYLRGRVSHLFLDACFVDVNGVGYRVFISDFTRRTIHCGSEVELLTYLQVREDAMVLFGFSSQDEYDMFHLLTSINGIGPKGAMGILSACEPKSLSLAISQKNIAWLTKLPGVGKKTAERLLVELFDKVSLPENDATDSFAYETSSETDGGDVKGEATKALLALGYAQAEFIPVLRKIDMKKMRVEDVIKLSLRELSKR